MFDLDFIEETFLEDDGARRSFGTATESLFMRFSIDSRTINPDDCFVAIKGENFDGHTFVPDCYRKGVRVFIVEKNRSLAFQSDCPHAVFFEVEDSIQALGKLALAYKKSIFSNVLAITGSSGKTTTREMALRVLTQKYNVHTAKKNLNNEIGLPLTILDAPNNTHIMALEMGMNHSGEIARLSAIAEPLTAIITNIGYAHIGNLGSRDAIARAKAEVFNALNPKGAVFLDRDDDYFAFLKGQSPAKVWDYGLGDFKIIEDRGYEGFILRYRGRAFETNITGLHNLKNLAGALRIGEYYQVDSDQAIGAIADFKPVSGRSEIIKGKITIINDCYNANPDSVKAGLRLLSKAKGRQIAVLGDMLELGEMSGALHTEIGEYIRRERLCDAVFLFGNEMKNTYDKILDKKTAFWFSDKLELITALTDFVRDGDTVLVKASRGMKLEDVVIALTNR